MLLLISKLAVIGIVTAILIMQWALATFALYLLLKDKGVKKGIIGWNLFITFAIIIGPCCYFISRARKNKA